MSTFLQLCVDAHRECNQSGTAPTTVAGQTGQMGRIVNWVRDSWTELQQRKQQWRWMRSTFTVTTTTGVDAYASGAITDSRLTGLITRFSRWHLVDDEGYDNCKIYLVSSGVGSETWLTFLSWSAFRSLYKTGAQNNGTPAYATIDPQNRILLGPAPNGAYVISGEYQMSPQTLTLDGDTPEMPSQFHQIIVFWTMKKYGVRRSAPEVAAGGITEGDRMMSNLELDQLPDFVMAGPLV